MEMQLVLIDDSDREWRIDDETREIGRRGIEAARSLLRAIPRRSGDEAVDTASDEATSVRHAA
jgi:hypothetical protein